MSNQVPIMTLNDGVKVPTIGFGTYSLNGQVGVQTILQAIDAGYRLLDSAFNYENEGTVGKAIRETSVPRAHLQIASKLPGRHQSYNEAKQTIQESVYRFGLDYIDLYLIHWPNPKQNLYVEAWQALIDAQKAGLVRSIGVSNFLPEHIEKLEKETGVLPAVNQIELHPYFNQEEQRTFDTAKGIITEAWSPLGRGKGILAEPLLQKIADKYGRSVPQIVLRWQTQLGVLTIPKSSSKERQQENLAIFDFEISEEDLKLIGTLTKEKGRIANQDPAFYEEF